MPIAVAILIIDLTLVVHAAKTGRLCPWGYIILAIPGLGALAYIGIELVPEWIGSIEGQKAQATLRKALDPNRRLRELSEELARTDSVANRVALAHECLNLGQFDEAREHFDIALRRPMGDEPAYMAGRARAEFGLNLFDRTVATLDELRARWPQFQSADIHLIYARALEGAGRFDEALAEYEALIEYFPGAEARVRLAQMLDKQGERGRAKAAFAEVIETFNRMPKYVRKVQAEWIAAAEKGLKA